MMQSSKQIEKILVAFDFDHTLIDDNSDMYVQKLAPNGKLPGNIRALHTERGWNKYMGAIFEYLHQNGTTKEDIYTCMREIPFVAGVVKLLEHLNDNKYSVVIISDANSVFIDCIMKASKLDHIIDKTYTNPASFNDSGCLTIQYYHTQDWCDLSTVNLCKGHILEEHIKEAAQNNVIFPVVAYVGDGSNDLCPCLRLKDCDYAFARKHFTLERKVKNLPEGKLKANVVIWENGFDILDVLQKLKV